MGRRLESALGVLNGLVGDYLAATGNGLATPMELLADGAPLELERAALARACPAQTRRLALLVHGLMCTEQVWRPSPAGAGGERQDYGALLERDLGYWPLYLRYSSGRPIVANGRDLAQLLEALVSASPAPLEEILLVGHSMGGLVVRSACEAARERGLRWLPRLRRVVFLGTPHHGAPLERFGRAVAAVLRATGDPCAEAVAQLGDLRSAGVKDLGDADLRQQDRARRQARPGRGRRRAVPLPAGVQHYVVAGTMARLPWLAALLGDALVPVASATARDAALPASHVRVMPGVGHLRLARHPGVYAQIRSWCEDGP